jgi:hypothetical protein
MLNIVLACLAGASAYGGLLTWSRHRILVAARAAKRYDRADPRLAGYKQS